MNDPFNDTEDLEKVYTSYLEQQLYLNKDGQWFHDGTAFEHKRLSLLFHRSIQFDTELDCYVLRIGKGRATFRHDGYVRFVKRLSDNGEVLTAYLADEREMTVSPEDLLISTADEAFLLTVNDEVARFTRVAQQEILEYAESERALTLHGNTFVVPFYENPAEEAGKIENSKIEDNGTKA